METLKLCESDYRFMCIIWENEPLASGQLVKLSAQKLGWKKSTTYTILKKMCEKGFARNENSVVTALVPQNEVQAYASGHFVEHTFGGSLPGFLASFLGDRTISEQEAAELKRLIDAHRKE